MDRHITLPRYDRKGFIDQIPVKPDVPGLFTGYSRTEFMKHIFSLAAEYGWEIRVAGQRWLPLATIRLNIGTILQPQDKGGNNAHAILDKCPLYCSSMGKSF